jgi:hypothetical protein
MVVTWLVMVSPSSGVASLRPRLGGESPWYVFVVKIVGWIGVYDGATFNLKALWCSCEKCVEISPLMKPFLYFTFMRCRKELHPIFI